MSELICLKRNKPVPKFSPTDYCNTCESECPEIFQQCLDRLGGVIFEGNVQLTLLKGGKNA